MNPWSFRESVSSQTCWSLRNIHFLNGNIYFSVSVNIFFPRSQVRLLPDTTISVQRRVSYKKQELFTIRENLCLPRIIGGVLVSHLFRFLFCAFICLHFVSVCPRNWLPFARRWVQLRITGGVFFSLSVLCFYFVCLCFVSCVPNFACASDSPFLIVPSVYSNDYL